MIDDDDDYVDELPVRPRQVIPAADRELLELAARALGAVRVEEIEGEQWLVLHFADGTVAHGWNPLIHSDDTFNLQVDLQMQVSVDDGQAVAGCADAFVEEANHADLRAAARRAIVRAAAEIGKAS